MKKIQTKYSAVGGAHYSPGIVYNGVLYISGQLSIDPETGKKVEGGMKAEAAQALKNLELVLESAGAKRGDVLQCRAYITDDKLWGEFNEAYIEFFGEHKPARAVIPVPVLYYGCQVEIEAVATVEGGQK